MGWGVQRGDALVRPGLHAANKAAERSSILKEQHKYMEEVRLRRPDRGGKGGGKSAKAGADGGMGGAP